MAEKSKMAAAAIWNFQRMLFWPHSSPRMADTKQHTDLVQIGPEELAETHLLVRHHGFVILQLWTTHEVHLTDCFFPENSVAMRSDVIETL